MKRKEASKITINDLAKELNTTPATVSRALNNHPRISDKTKKRVQDLAKKYNYQPNIVASNFRKGKVNSVGIVVPYINRHYFSNVIFSIEMELMKADYTVVICQTMDDPKLEEKYINMLIGNKVSGIIISSAKNTENVDALKKALDIGIKIVQFDNVLLSLDTSIFRNDDIEAAYTSTKHLLSKGYRHIAIFNGNMKAVVYQDRYKGYLKAHEEFNIEAQEELCFYGVNTQEEGKKAVQHLIDNHLTFDAIYSTGDYAALGAYLELKKAGIRIPQEVGISGYANEPFTAFVSPSITSTDPQCQEIGHKTAMQILKEIEDDHHPKVVESISSQLYSRDSTERE